MGHLDIGTSRTGPGPPGQVRDHLQNHLQVLEVVLEVVLVVLEVVLVVLEVVLENGSGSGNSL